MEISAADACFAGVGRKRWNRGEPLEVVMAREAGRTSSGSGASRTRTGDLLGAIREQLGTEGD